MTAAAGKYLGTLAPAERERSVLPFETPERMGWHFIPKSERKGLQVKEMTAEQRQAAHTLLRTALSEIGYDKATKIMALEGLLRELEKGRQGGAIRDPERYYVTLFGDPQPESRWGLSVEGHHLSLNFVVDQDQVVSSTPAFMGANPAVVQHQLDGLPEKGTRVLGKEEQLAFRLLRSLEPPQRERSVIAAKAPRDIRAAGEAEAPAYEPTGLGFDEMNAAQQGQLLRLIDVYAANFPKDVATERRAAIDQAGHAQIYFAWAGADKPGEGHYYRIQGPTFVIEFANTQPDAAGNPASHIHAVWRDPRGDFGNVKP
jgi:hypothetical protein